MRFLVGIGEVALCAVLQLPLRQEGKGRDDVVPGLRFHLVKVDGAFLHACRRAGLEAAQRKPQFAKRLREGEGRPEPLRAAVPDGFADDNAAVHVHARRDERGLARDARAGRRLHRLDLARGRKDDAADLALPHFEVILREERAAHSALIGAFVCLRAQGMHGRALAGIEHAALNERVVDGAAHFAAERVHLAHQMALGRPADGGVAGHERDGVQIERQQQRGHAHARSGQRRLAARMPRADDAKIVLQEDSSQMLRRLGGYRASGPISAA